MIATFTDRTGQIGQLDAELSEEQVRHLELDGFFTIAGTLYQLQPDASADAVSGMTIYFADEQFKPVGHITAPFHPSQIKELRSKGKFALVHQVYQITTIG